MTLEDPGPGRCDVCGERVPARHPFLVQVKNVGVSPAARTTAWVNVVGAHCERCDRHFQVFRARRLQAIATMVLAALIGAPLVALAGSVGRAAPMIVVVLLAAVVIAALARVAMRHDALRDEVGDELLDDLARGLPSPPGVLRWSEVRFFPSVPRSFVVNRVEPHHSLEALRRRADRRRELPN